MDDFLFALNTVLPLLLMMGCGFFCRKIGVMSGELVKGVNQLVFRVFLPVNLCLSVMKTPYDTPLGGTPFVLTLAGLTVVYVVMMFLMPRWEKDPRKIGVMVQGVGRGNYAFFGIPLVAMLFPGQDTALASLMVTVTIPVYNVMSVIALCAYGDEKPDVKKMIKSIVKNPLIIGTAAGYILWSLRVQFPSFISSTLTDLGKVATPLALFTLGGAIEFSSAKGHLKQLLLVAPLKLIVVPAIFVGLAVALGVRGVALACIYIAFGAPTAVSSYPMAQQMGADGELSAEIVAVTSALCSVTTFLFVFLMKRAGLI